MRPTRPHPARRRVALLAVASMLTSPVTPLLQAQTPAAAPKAAAPAGQAGPGQAGNADEHGTRARLHHQSATDPGRRTGLGAARDGRAPGDRSG